MPPGSQGEPTSAMVRMSLNDHRQLTLRPGDTVVLSATPIPGNEELFNRTVDNLFRQGANVLYHELGNVHVSGHGGQDDYRHMLSLVRPRYLCAGARRIPPPGAASSPGRAGMGIPPTMSSSSKTASRWSLATSTATAR